jgi:hypothetical protein
VIKWLDGMFETNEAGTITTVFHDVGTATVAGTKTNCEAATLEIAEAGTDKTKLEATDDGTCDHSTTANDGDEAIMMTYEVLNDETADAGKTTGDLHVVGTVTVLGTET